MTLNSELTMLGGREDAKMTQIVKNFNNNKKKKDYLSFQFYL